MRVDRLASDGLVGVGQGAELVVVILEDVRVDGAQGDALRARVRGQVTEVVDHIPGDVQGHPRGDPGEVVNLCRVVDLFVGVARGAGAREDLEAGPGVAERPARQLDGLLAQQGVGAFGQVGQVDGHDVSFDVWGVD